MGRPRASSDNRMQPPEIEREPAQAVGAYCNG
jgi:hypothetical protein